MMLLNPAWLKWPTASPTPLPLNPLPPLQVGAEAVVGGLVVAVAVALFNPK